jgi:hypothetical protein
LRHSSRCLAISFPTTVSNLKFLCRSYFNFALLSVSKFNRLILLMTTSSASKIAISSTLALLMTCTTEIVSPEKRRLCGYTSTVWTRVWLLSAPFVGATSVFGQLGNYEWKPFANSTLLFCFSSPDRFVAFEYPWLGNNIFHRHPTLSTETRKVTEGE